MSRKNDADPPVIDPTANVLGLVKAAIRRQDDLRAAETRRIDDLAAMRNRYEQRISDMLSRQVEQSAILLSTQVNDRLSKLEQFRYESSGRGVGASQVWGYIFAVMAFLAAAVATAAYFLKTTPS